MRDGFETKLPSHIGDIQTSVLEQQLCSIQVIIPDKFGKRKVYQGFHLSEPLGTAPSYFLTAIGYWTQWLRKTIVSGLLFRFIRLI